MEGLKEKSGEKEVDGRNEGERKREGEWKEKSGERKRWRGGMKERERGWVNGRIKVERARGGGEVDGWKGHEEETEKINLTTGSE
ncbi:hypothetical protein Pmani_031877 [Petrolisthes manimaculis]|uniref:Uncharacterized protein n=1 Tax=Petrolisthes manimaculis TaxID=1843537 RepID=A0AAE1TUD5_9EUCA|nr:hypothetical protein Pmani_031877 [Petrolisthes manimaculis]